MPRMAKIDVDAVGGMLDKLLGERTEVIRRSEFEDLEPDYEYLKPTDGRLRDPLVGM